MFTKSQIEALRVAELVARGFDVLIAARMVTGVK
jgi:hypothetical protein